MTWRTRANVGNSENVDLIAQATLLPFSFMLVVILQVVLWSHVWHEEVIQSFLNWKAGTHWVDIVWQQWGLIGNTNLTFDADKKVHQSDKLVVSSLLCLACCCIECVWLADVAPCCFWILNWRQLAAYVFWLNTRGHYRDLLREMRPGVDKQARAIWSYDWTSETLWLLLRSGPGWCSWHCISWLAKPSWELGSLSWKLHHWRLWNSCSMKLMKKRTLKHELNWMWIHRGCVAAKLSCPCGKQVSANLCHTSLQTVALTVFAPSGSGGFSFGAGSRVPVFSLWLSYLSLQPFSNPNLKSRVYTIQSR